MSRTKSHRPRKARPYGENIDNAANLPTHGRGGSFIRSLNRAMDDRLLRVKSRERIESLRDEVRHHEQQAREADKLLHTFCNLHTITTR
jgi:hypothetical protein